MSIYPDDEPNVVYLSTKFSIKCKFCQGMSYPIKLISKSPTSKDYDVYKFKCKGCLIEISEQFYKTKPAHVLNNNISHKRHV